MPKPFGDFAALSLADDDAAKDLLAGVADALQLSHPQKLHFAEFLKQMRAAAAKSGLVQVVASAAVEIAPVGLPNEQSAILQLLAASANGGQEEIPERQAVSISGLTAAVFKYHAAELEDANLIYIGRDMTGTYCRITAKGSGWLIKNKLMPA